MFKVNEAKPYGDFMALSPTNECPLRCRHCISNSGPKEAAGSEIFLEQLDDFFSSNPFQTSRVSLTGGEPLLNLARAGQLIDMLARRSIQCVVVTSAYWAKNVQAAREVLEKLHGLSGMTISYDPYHAEFVKPHFIRNAFEAAKERGVPTRIRLVRSFPATQDDEKILQIIKEFCQEDDLEIQRLINYGRAREQLDSAGYSSPVMTFCPSTGPHISHDGTVTPCCSSIMSITKKHPLQLGNIYKDSPEEVLDEFRRSVLLLALKTEGKSYFQDALSQRGLNVGEMQICDLCYEICNDPDLWKDLQSALFSPEESYRLYANALVAFGFKEFEAQAKEAAKAAILAEVTRRAGDS